MSVSRRKTSRGLTESYHYRFFYKGKLYYGVCAECANKKEAEDFEKKQRDIVKASVANKAPGVIPQVIKSLHHDLTGRKPEKISIEEAFEKSLGKPKKRKASGDFLNAKRSYWKDFALFMADKHPEAEYLSDINKFDAEAYVSYVREKGRYYKKVKSKDGKEYERKGNLSPKSANVILDTLREVLRLLQNDAGIFENPFDGIQKLSNESESREPFTEKELKTIFKNADDFIYPIFAIGIATGLREGDICTLLWDEVNFEHDYIRRKMLKTKHVIEVPLIPGLRQYLLDLKAKSDKKQKYVLPIHADMYLKNSQGISYRVKDFLESLGIKTTREVKGRTRLVSVKDVHSLRHSFAYIAGLYSIPLVIVQSILGHMTPEMTSQYQRHADNKAKTTALANMPDFITSSIETEKDIKLISSGIMAEIQLLLSKADEKILANILSFIKKEVQV